MSTIPGSAAAAVARPGADRWELWNLRALRPDATAGDLDRLRREQARILRLQAELESGFARDPLRWLRPGHEFMAANRDLLAGIVVTMHVGPYQVLPEPFLAAGASPAVLLDRAAHRQLAGRADAAVRRLGLRGAVEWVTIESPLFARRLLASLRRGRPVIAFLDGNSGLGGTERTRRDGLDFELPGRRIRIRNGLGRLAGRVGCPVHGLLVRWGGRGGIRWDRGPSWRWERRDDPDDIARALYEWGFGEVAATPAQWSYWGVLRESYACFGEGKLAEPDLPPEVRADLARALRICLDRAPGVVRVELTREVEAWPGDVLADLTGERFFPAAGLSPEHLAALAGRAPSLRELERRFGRPWVEFQVLRLCLLDLVRLRGGPPGPP